MNILIILIILIIFFEIIIKFKIFNEFTTLIKLIKNCTKVIIDKKKNESEKINLLLFNLKKAFFIQFKLVVILFLFFLFIIFFDYFGNLISLEIISNFKSINNIIIISILFTIYLFLRKFYEKKL